MRMEVEEDPRYSREYLEADKRSIANAVQVFFTDGTATPKIEVEYPIGHQRRRKEGFPLLDGKFRDAVSAHFEPGQAGRIFNMFSDSNALDQMAVDEFVGALMKP